MRSYRPEELFDANGALDPGARRAAAQERPADERQPARQRRRCCCATSACPTSATTPSTCRAPGRHDGRGDPGPRAPSCATSSTANRDNFRIFGPDETASNRLGAVFEVTDRAVGRRDPADRRAPGAATGRVMEVLSEHLCQGWLEGYLLTGRHGLFNCYEAFIHIVDSMFNQHAKWLKVTRDIPWRRPIASLNYLLSSHVWRQDHNGFSPPGPGLHRPRRQQEGRTSSGSTCRPTRTPCSRSRDHCLRSRNYVNVIVAGKQPGPNWLSMDEAILHCTRGHRHLGLGQQRPATASRTS